MILQALKEYYDRKTNFQENEHESQSMEGSEQIAPPGFEWKEISWVIILSPDGTPVSIEDTRVMKGKKLRAKAYLVPHSVKRTVGIKANLLWDSADYALGLDIKGRPDRVIDQHKAFRDGIAALDGVEDEALLALKLFLDRSDKLSLLSDLGDFSEDKSASISFKLAGDTVTIAERPALKAAIGNSESMSTGEQRICLVSGVREEVMKLHPAIRGVWGAQPTGGNIVSFNLGAFLSYGKNQGENAPVGKTTVFAYTTALNQLLGRDSNQRLQVGDSTTVFWASKKVDFEQNFGFFLNEPAKENPDRLVSAVRDLYKAVDTGVYAEDMEARFHVLGLAPNASRLSVRFWITGSVAEIADAIKRHFDDVAIVHGPKEHDHLSVFRLLVSTAVQGKSENMPSHLAGDFMRSILEKRPYPRALLQAAVVRVRAEHEVNYPRAALIKACLNRFSRIGGSGAKKELQMSLDTTNKNSGYLLGRLFAVLERVQEEANPGINATIRDRFYGAASSTPVMVFGNLMRLKNHHVAKIDSTGRQIYYERLIGQIVEGITDFPAHLSLDDQGRFAIGYYHQRQDFYTKKDEKPEIREESK
jgi:CRISPR-associated protein Csd1